MSRSYAKLFVSVWDSGSDFLDLDTDSQWLYWMLLSHPLLSPAGVLPLQPRKWAKRARGMTERRVLRALNELAGNHKVVVDDDTEEVLIRTFIRHDNGWRTPNVRKSIETSLQRIESGPLRREATLELTHAVTLDGTLSGRVNGTLGGTLSEGVGATDRRTDGV